MNHTHGVDVLTRARNGDERAFLALYRAAQPGLLRYLSVLVGAQAEQVAQQTWAEVNLELATFPGELDAFRTWVAGIGRRRAHELLQRQEAAGEELRGIDVLGGPTPPRAAQALRLIADLPVAEAEAITLRAVMGMGEDEAAQVLGTGRTALRRTAERGLRALVRRLEPVPVSTPVATPVATPVSTPVEERSVIDPAPQGAPDGVVAVEDLSVGDGGIEVRR